MPLPTLSVVVPCYNESRFIRAALQSLLAQTRVPDEIILVDDASTDDSAAIAATLAQTAPQLRIQRNRVNCGGVRSSNIGLAAARGECVFFMAANDVVAPDFCARSLAMLAAHPQAGLSSALCWLLSEEGRPLSVMPTPLVLDRPGFIAPASARDLLWREGNWIVGSATVYRTAALRAAGGFVPELLSFCDAFAGPAIAARHGAAFLPVALAGWRQHKGGFASDVTADPSRIVPVLDHLSREGPRVAPELFGPAYLRRLLHRARFESVAAILRRQPDRVPDGFAALAGLPAPLARSLAGLARMPGGGRILALGLLFLILRPFDLVSLLRRRRAWRQAGPAIIGKGF